MTTLAKINGIKTKICKHKETERNRAASNGLLQSQGLCLHEMLSTANSVEEELVLYAKLQEQQSIVPLQSRRKFSGSQNSNQASSPEDLIHPCWRSKCFCKTCVVIYLISTRDTSLQTSA